MFMRATSIVVAVVTTIASVTAALAVAPIMGAAVAVGVGVTLVGAGVGANWAIDKYRPTVDTSDAIPKFAARNILRLTLLAAYSALLTALGVTTGIAVAAIAFIPAVIVLAFKITLILILAPLVIAGVMLLMGAVTLLFSGLVSR